MKKLALLVALVFLFCLSSQAQGLYGFNYQSNGVNYDALLVWYSSGQPFLRTTYYHPRLQKYVTVQQNITYNNRGTYETLDGSNPVFLTPVGSTDGYAADHFVFQRMPNGFYACTGMIDDAGQVGVIKQFRPVATYEVTNTFLQYFAFSPPTNVSIPNSTNVTMHLIVVADIEDRKIGEAGKVDVQGMAKEFQAAANEIGVTLRQTLIAGESFSRTNVVNALNNLKPGSNDIVVFVYTRHGFRFDDDTDAYPRFAITRNRQSVVGNNFSASEVYNTLKNKGARLNITIVDACNKEIGFSKPDVDKGVVLKPSDAGISRRAVATLFLNTRGNIIVAAAKKGQLAGADSKIGGIFMYSFLDAFMYETSVTNSSSPSWKTIIENAGDLAYKKSGGDQTAIYSVDVR